MFFIEYVLRGIYRIEVNVILKLENYFYGYYLKVSWFIDRFIINFCF